MKKYVTLLLAVCMLVMVSCAREPENYNSKREKNENMQDIEIVSIKEGQEVLAVETDEFTAVETSEAPAEEDPRPVTQTDESELVPTNPSEEEEGEDAEEDVLPFTTSLYGILNMREGAGTEYEIVSTLYEGDEITLTGEEFAGGSLWYSATSGSYEGFVQADAYYLVGPNPED